MHIFFSLSSVISLFFFFFFNDTATTEIYTLSLHDALPIFEARVRGPSSPSPPHRPLVPPAFRCSRHRHFVAQGATASPVPCDLSRLPVGTAAAYRRAHERAHRQQRPAQGSPEAPRPDVARGRRARAGSHAAPADARLHPLRRRGGGRAAAHRRGNADRGDHAPLRPPFGGASRHDPARRAEDDTARASRPHLQEGERG